jgi:hypothetical protein
MAIDCVGSPTGISTPARSGNGASKQKRTIAPQILDFRFWILDWRQDELLEIQNPKSKIQNCTPRAASAAERTARRSRDIVQREVD